MDKPKLSGIEQITFEPIGAHQSGIISSLLLESFADVMDEKLRQKIIGYEKEVFENPGTVGACIFITSISGEAVGLASWDPRQWPETGIVGWNCVRPKYRGRGIGRLQIDEVLRRFRLKGFKKAVVRTGEHPFYKSAQKNYENCGFILKTRHPTGDQPGYGTLDYEWCSRAQRKKEKSRIMQNARNTHMRLDLGY